MFSESQSSPLLSEDLLPRAERTLELMHRWGYAPTVEALANDLIGGRVSPNRLRDAMIDSGIVTFADSFVCLRGQEYLLASSQVRERANRAANGRASAVGEDFARVLAGSCPFVDAVALSGSVASGGYIPSDDIDFDLFVRNGTKYLTYAVAVALGFVFSLRLGGGGFRKIICINVIWTTEQVSPFLRTDPQLAFELLHCRPLIGAPYFRTVIHRNRWIERYFPQTFAEPIADVPRPLPSWLGKLLGAIAGHRILLYPTEKLARAVTFLVYRAVHFLQRKNRTAMERLAFLQRVKYPYEVFQD